MEHAVPEHFRSADRRRRASLRWGALAIVVVVAVACAVAVPGRVAGAAPPPGWDQDMLGQVNAARSSAGRAPLQLCPSLDEAAMWQSEYQASIDTMQHDGQGGSKAWDRADATGYTGWNTIGENVAATSGSAYDVSRVMGLWLNSSGHYANITDPRFTHLGVGAAYSGTNGTVYWTQVFGANGSCSPVTPRPPIAVDGGFADVPPHHPFRDAIDRLVARGITTGYPDGTFRGSDPVSRQAMAAFLHRAAGSPPVGCEPQRFTDVGAGNRFCPEITWLSASGVTGGYPDGGFRPGDSVSRQAMAAFLFRSQHPGQEPPPCDSPFNDVGPSNAFCGEITWLASSGIAGGYPDGGFHPGASVSRQAMAAFLDRLPGGG
jgi:hypothetical protein